MLLDSREKLKCIIFRRILTDMKSWKRFIWLIDGDHKPYRIEKVRYKGSTVILKLVGIDDSK